MKRYAYAVVRDDPPYVFAADDVDLLQWVLALRLVAQTPAATIPAGRRDGLRDALLEERWGDAVVAWIEITGVPVDVYEDLAVWSAADISEETALLEIQFAPLFQD